ncbi:hypothetical protein GQ53DRAFT_774761 [Thozetella sp. PMI_491]|nr:hypothetical protein GQ53DRAFT_774761 [Thozetella sp. PMI_491]
MSTASSGLAPAQAPESSAVRPRNRRLISTADGGLSTPSASPSRGVSPIPSAHIGSVTGRNNAELRIAGGGAGVSKGFAGGLLDGSWSWSSVQEFASSLLIGTDTTYDSGTERPGSRDGSRARKAPRKHGGSAIRNDSWGPAPPTETRPRLEDVGAGTLAKREAKLKAMKKASVLESHEGVNGGLDITGKFKKRTSDEDLRSTAEAQEVPEHLVYIHHVQKTDTYAGIVLKYRCREEAFRKANGLWSRDNIQVRKWLAIPVDACEIKGRPCDASTFESGEVDLLAPTPDPTADEVSRAPHDDFFSRPTNGKSAEAALEKEEEEKPWTHVRWVVLDSFPKPVEIARVARREMGYFPPRRKKSQHTVSTLSTPRGSLDVPSITRSSEAAVDSPGSPSSRRHSLLSNNRPHFAAYGSSTPTTTRSRRGSVGDERKPQWMRRPGGVGSLNRSVRAPGPEKDYFNSWTRKHIPGLNIESLPSMSIMGSETARFGFDPARDGAPAGIVESPFEEGRDVTSTTQQGSGLDKAAATIETWLRGAFAKRPGTPILGPRGRQPAEEGDLIELTDTNSDDGRGYTTAGGSFGETGLLSSSGYSGALEMSYGEGAASRGRSLGGGGGAMKNKKSD